MQKDSRSQVKTEAHTPHIQTAFPTPWASAVGECNEDSWSP